MKRFFKIFGISLGALLGLLILAIVLVPVLFKGKLTTIAKNAANESLNAVVDFKNLDISMFKNFPNITVSLQDFSIIGTGQFQGDTLASAASFSAGVNLMSYLRNDIVDIQVVQIEKPQIHAMVSEDGTVNWDITKPSETTEVEAVPAGESSGFNLKIKKFVITDGSVMYEDVQGSMLAVLKNLNFSLKGDLSDKHTKLEILTSAEKINVLANSIIWVSNASFSLDAKVDADLENMQFTLSETNLGINRIDLMLDGNVKMNEADILIDLAYAAKVESLKTLLEMIPSAMLPDVQNVDTKGSMALTGWVKGTYSEESMPQIWTELKVGEGFIKYARLPKSIDNINIDAKALFDANQDANTQIDLNRFHFEIGGNPFDLTANVKTPMTDANIKSSVKGKLDFASLKDALPLEGVDLKGLMTANVDFAGRMSAIEAEAYETLKLDGSLKLQNFTAITKDLPMAIDIANTDLEFTPKYVNLGDLTAQLGESDIKASGRLENFLNYALKGDELKGSLQLSSKYINCNQFMSGAPESKPSVKDSASTMSVIVLPSDVNLSVTAKVDKILYDNIILNNAVGNVTIKDGALNINNLGAGFAGGNINLSGKYMAETTASAFAGLNMDIKNVKIKDLITSFDMFDKLVPFLKETDGKVSMNFNFSDKLDQNMSPILMALSGVGTLKADSLKLLDTQTLNKITSLIGIKEQSNIVKNLQASFTVTDGKVGVQPFNASLGTTKMMIGGQYGLDQSLDTQIDMQIPAAKVTGAVNDLISQLGGGKNLVTANNVNVGIAVGGTIKSPSFKLAKPKYMTESPGVAEQTTDQAKQMVEDKAKQLQEQAKDEVKKQAADKIKDIFKKW
ncbi:MAG: AsmA family protein [Prevotellaceae bacterium]|jgi:hypothetical protein|nr:AsmA family protein [Prevotellaceae bacterium]